jgi:hypothetical protein
LPALNVAMSTSTPTRARTGSGAGSIDPALYTIVVSNTGGTATGVRLQGSLQNNLFRYDGTYIPTVTLSSGSATGYTLPSNGVSQPEFGPFTIPAGATLTITFRATIENTVQNGVAYQASTGVEYVNPMRTSAANATVQPGGNYAGGEDITLGTAGGESYTGSASTAEDVTITAPLPVSLSRFTAAVRRLDAQLRWTTASERSNDRFVVERSLDGTSFEPVGNVRGQGESARPMDYEFIDIGAARLTASSKPVFYRLRQVDFDGTATYSPVREVLFGAKGDITVYPNPAGTSTTLDLSGLPTGDYSVQVLDLAGRQVANYSLSGASQHPLDLQSLAAGTYMVRVRGGAINQSLRLTRE